MDLNTRFRLETCACHFLPIAIAHRQFKLYRANGDCSIVPHTLLRKLSLSLFLPAVQVEFGDGATTQDEYRMFIPTGPVHAPRMTSSDGNNTIMTEMHAIMMCIACLKTEGNQQTGLTPIEKAEVAVIQVDMPNLS